MIVTSVKGTTRHRLCKNCNFCAPHCLGDGVAPDDYACQRAPSFPSLRPHLTSLSSLVPLVGDHTERALEMSRRTPSRSREMVDPVSARAQQTAVEIQAPDAAKTTDHGEALEA
ncbi:unnamed protein product [Arctogadus glacialis]